MPLTFDERRLLPPGIHDATLEEIERHFALSGRRRALFEKLKEYLSFVRLTGWACQVLIDGSFVMPAVTEPQDIDIILVLPDGWDLGRRDFKPFEYNVIDRAHTRRTYKIEVYAVAPGSERYDFYFTLFTKVRIEWCRQFNLPPDAEKGIVRFKP
jgi:hypothetical protein